MDVNLEGGREGIEVARWLREVCKAPVVFITGYTDRDTIARIREQVPGAPVLPKPVLGTALPRLWRRLWSLTTEPSFRKGLGPS